MCQIDRPSKSFPAVSGTRPLQVYTHAITIIGISASPTACPLRGYGRAGTQNDLLSESF